MADRKEQVSLTQKYRQKRENAFKRNNYTKMDDEKAESALLKSKESFFP